MSPSSLRLDPSVLYNAAVINRINKGARRPCTDLYDTNCPAIIGKIKKRINTAAALSSCSFLVNGGQFKFILMAIVEDY